MPQAGNPNEYTANGTILRELPSEGFVDFGFRIFEVQILVDKEPFKMIAALPSSAVMSGIKDGLEIQPNTPFKIDFELQGKVV